MNEQKPRVLFEWECDECGSTLIFALGSAEEWPEKCACGAELLPPEDLEEVLRRKLGQ